jgi:hypothetical protein
MFARTLDGIAVRNLKQKEITHERDESKEFLGRSAAGAAAVGIAAGPAKGQDKPVKRVI